VQDTPASNTLYCAIRYKCFSISSEVGTFHKVNDSPSKKKKPFSDHKYFFNKLSQFSQLNNVLEPPASNIIFLQKTRCFFHSLDGSILHNGDVTHI
jgi:hypothetical protein